MQITNTSFFFSQCFLFGGSCTFILFWYRRCWFIPRLPTNNEINKHASFSSSTTTLPDAVFAGLLFSLATVSEGFLSLGFPDDSFPRMLVATESVLFLEFCTICVPRITHPTRFSDPTLHHFSIFPKECFLPGCTTQNSNTKEAELLATSSESTTTARFLTVLPGMPTAEQPAAHPSVPRHRHAARETFPFPELETGAKQGWGSSKNQSGQPHFSLHKQERELSRSVLQQNSSQDLSLGCSGCARGMTRLASPIQFGMPSWGTATATKAAKAD